MLRMRIALVFVSLLVAAPASGSPETLRRSFGNLLQAPLDFALAPVTAGIAARENMEVVTDNPVGRAGYVVGGYPGLVLLQVGIASARMVTGVVQFLPGLALLPFEADLPGRFDYFSQGRALVEGENPLSDSPIRYVPPLTAFTIDPRFGVITDIVLNEQP